MPPWLGATGASASSRGRRGRPDRAASAGGASGRGPCAVPASDRHRGGRGDYAVDERLPPLLAETMEDAAEDPDAVRRFAGRMQTETRRLSHLVQEIIELSRVQGNSALTDGQPVEVDDVITEAVALNRNFALGSRIEVAVGGTSGLRVFGSSAMLTTAMSNLISNAITYSDADTRIGVSVRRDGGMVELSVKDQGIGISKENLERVFERFFRVDRARSRDTGGSGLGLAIVKHIATDHGGEVTAWSMAGQGSTFTLRIPEMGHTGAVTVGGDPSRTSEPDIDPGVGG